MANKKETKTTKEPVVKKSTVKKTAVKKPVKKVTETKVITKIEVKKDELKKTEIVSKKEKISLKDKLKNFFNSPQPLFVVFIFIILGLLFYNIQYSKHDTIYVGHYTGDNGTVGAIHCFTNHKINVFYATTATYDGEDKKLYAYEIGYYYEDGEDLKPFVIRSGKMDTGVSVKQIINENSYFNISELATSKVKFTEDAMQKMDKLHFVVYGATKKDSDVVDFVIDYPIEFDHIV